MTPHSINNMLNSTSDGQSGLISHAFNSNDDANARPLSFGFSINHPVDNEYKKLREQVSALTTLFLDQKKKMELMEKKIETQQAQIESLSKRLLEEKAPETDKVFGQSGILPTIFSNSVVNLINAETISTPAEISQPTDEATRRKKINRILAAIPPVTTSNPNAALINFCKHQLKFDVDFRSIETPDGVFTIQIYFPNNEIAASEKNQKKKVAKEAASKIAIARLNNDNDFLYKWIEYSQSRP